MNLEAAWLNAFVQTFDRCAIGADESVVVLCEQQTRDDLIALAELALAQKGCRYFRLGLPTPASVNGPLVRSSGASLALIDQSVAVATLCQADVVIDLTVEGLMHAVQTAQILKSGTRIMNISNEHPEALSRMLPDDALQQEVKSAVKRIRAAGRMQVSSAAGTDLTVDLKDASTVGVWGWTDRPGTLAHWPGGLVVSFPAAGAVNGTLVLDAGDLNLTFKRYIESPVALHIVDDYVQSLEGSGADCALMQSYLAAFDDPAAYATSHVGWGLNPQARYEAMTMYDRNDTNGTELRAVAGNFLYSTGANEFAGRFTRGHFDLPVMGCTIALDGEVVVAQGVPV
jgi:2,5-dihydroxypyridine 5,6-dioxygenase